MTNNITTIYLPSELKEYVQTANINLSKFIREVLYEHSGICNQHGQQEINKLQTEIMELTNQISTKKTLLQQKIQENKEKEDLLAQQKAEFELLKTKCRMCKVVELTEHDKQYHKYFCNSCWGSRGSECYKLINKIEAEENGR